MALFIKPESVPAGPFTVHGDNRDFQSISDPGASRGYIWISTETGEVFSHMNESKYLKAGGIPVDWTFDASDKNIWSVQRLDNGIIEVQYDLVISGPLDWTGTAPHINGTISFKPSADGTVDYNFIRDGFPWAEAYYHDRSGNITTIFQDPAIRGNPHDLFGIEPNITWRQDLVRGLQSEQFGSPLISTSPFYFTPRAYGPLSSTR